MSLLIKNGQIVTASESYVADIFCENETITRIDRGITAPRGAEVIDAKGKFVFPGFIDPHVHIYLPFMGTFSKDNYVTGSQAALDQKKTHLMVRYFALRPQVFFELYVQADLWRRYLAKNPPKSDSD